MKETILFRDGRDPLDNIITILVQPVEGGASTTLVGDPLVDKVGEVFSFTLTPENIPQDLYSQLMRDCDDTGGAAIYEQQDIASHLDHTVSISILEARE